MDILIIDDHPVFSAGLRELLLAENSGLEIELCTNFKKACESINGSLPNLILLDLDLGGENGIELTAALLKLDPALKIAILSASESVEDMLACVENGAIGYITKSLDPDTLLKAIDLLCSSGSYFPSNLLPYLVSNQTKNEKKTYKLDIFTSRQIDVLECLKNGKSNKLIGYELGITEGTVKLHVSTILEKLKVNNRSEAIIASLNLCIN